MRNGRTLLNHRPSRWFSRRKNNPPEIPTGCLYGLFFFFLPVAFHFFHKGIVTLGLRGFGHLPGRPVWGIICPLFQLFIRGVRFLTVLFWGLARFFYHLTLLGRIGRGLRVGGLLRAAKRIAAYRTPGFIL